MILSASHVGSNKTHGQNAPWPKKVTREREREKKGEREGERERERERKREREKERTIVFT